MPQFHTPIPAIATEFPICSHCGAPMQLARIESAESGHEQRYFECPDCGKSETLAAKTG